MIVKSLIFKIVVLEKLFSKEILELIFVTKIYYLLRGVSQYLITFSKKSYFFQSALMSCLFLESLFKILHHLHLNYYWLFWSLFMCEEILLLLLKIKMDLFLLLLEMFKPLWFIFWIHLTQFWKLEPWIMEYLK